MDDAGFAPHLSMLAGKQGLQASTLDLWMVNRHL
jgi:hypothetical protein